MRFLKMMLGFAVGIAIFSIASMIMQAMIYPQRVSPNVVVKFAVFAGLIGAGVMRPSQ